MIVTTMFLFFAGPLQLRAQPADKPPERSSHPVLVNTCVVTKNVNRLVAFYEPVLGLKAQWSGDDYAEFATGTGVLAIFSSSAQEKYIPGSAEAATNRSVILEFDVADVDAEYRRLKDMVQTWVKPPTTQPWAPDRSIFANRTEISWIFIRLRQLRSYANARNRE